MGSRFRSLGATSWPIGSLVGSLIASYAAIGASNVQAADASHPAVVELFQSQGCSSCPPANGNVNALSERADVLALSFAVTYWTVSAGRTRSPNPSSRSGSGNMRGRCANRMFIRRRSR